MASCSYVVVQSLITTMELFKKHSDKVTNKIFSTYGFMLLRVSTEFDNDYGAIKNARSVRIKSYKENFHLYDFLILNCSIESDNNGAIEIFLKRSNSNKFFFSLFGFMLLEYNHNGILKNL